MEYRKLGRTGVTVSSMNVAMELVMSDERLAAVDRLRPIARASGVQLAPLARPGIKHR